MQPPFTADQFFDVFRRYNEAIWPFQVGLVGLAVLTIVLLFAGSERANRAIAASLALMWTWMALGYHLAFFHAINPAAPVFAIGFLVGAFAFFWAGVLRKHLRFRARWNLQCFLGSLLVIYALVGHPLLSWALGHRYPATPTFGAPCPTTLYTIGLLTFSVAPFPRYILIVPILWTIVGSQAAWLFGVYQDLALIGAGALGTWLLVQRHG